MRAKIFGLNAAKPYGIDIEEVRLRAQQGRLAHRRENYLNQPDPSFLTYGPKTRREFLNLKKWERSTG